MSLSELFFNAFVNTGPIDTEYKLIQVNENVYIGLNDRTQAALVVISNEPQKDSVKISTKEMDLEINASVSINHNSSYISSIVNIICCSFHSDQELKVFWDICEMFCKDPSHMSNQYLIDTFITLKTFFSSKKELSFSELEGLYAELFTIWSFKDVIRLSDFWQSTDKMKFDFSFNSKDKLEIKSTLSPVRKHHFRHDQLQSDIFEIYILSYLMREDDQGLCAFDLIENVIQLLEKNEKQKLRLLKILNDNSMETLKSLRFNETFLVNQRRFYNARDIPKFNEKSPDGVINAEYDCILTEVKPIEEREFLNFFEISINTN